MRRSLSAPVVIPHLFDFSTRWVRDLRRTRYDRDRRRPFARAISMLVSYVFLRAFRLRTIIHRAARSDRDVGSDAGAVRTQASLNLEHS